MEKIKRKEVVIDISKRDRIIINPNTGERIKKITRGLTTGENMATGTGDDRQGS